MIINQLISKILKVNNMINNYVEITVKDHPKKRPNGCVYEHILVAEKFLGRYLTDEEVVHHIDHNRNNNDILNLMIFKSQADHARYHSNSYSNINTINNIWSCNKLIKICKHCNNEFEPTQKRIIYCSKTCAAIKSRKSERPTKEKLIELLNSKNFVEVGKLYNVSDNAVRKWCKTYEISYSSKDYK